MAGHAERMVEMRNAYKIWVGTSQQRWRHRLTNGLTNFLTFLWHSREWANNTFTVHNWNF